MLKSLAIYHQIQLLGIGCEDKRQAPSHDRKEGIKRSAGPGTQKAEIQSEGCWSKIVIV